ncbi:MAG: hypothetical protein A2W19_15070 [Spirochaetes bacterium RBG_16_49_21]|nr:MAG: hypothetical protein A2W19_15070 [Spirochaetes bacterium RBG_16_49_21]
MHLKRIKLLHDRYPPVQQYPFNLPIFRTTDSVDFTGAQILSFDHASIRSVRYEDTDHYRIYKNFLDDRDKYFHNEFPLP